MRRHILVVVLALTPAASTAQSEQPKKQHSQKEVHAALRAEDKTRAAEIQAKLDDHIKTATNPGENSERRHSALETLGRSQDLRAVKPLLDTVDDADKTASHSALTGLTLMAWLFDDNPAQMAEFKKRVEPKAQAIAKEDPARDLDRAAGAVSLLNKIGDEADAVQLAKKVLSNGRYSIIKEFARWDESVEPPVFRISPAAKQLFLDSTTKARPEGVRAEAAALLARAGEKTDAFPVLTDVMLHGSDVNARIDAMRELRTIGDEPSKEAVREAAKIPELARSAKYVLMFWDKRPKK